MDEKPKISKEKILEFFETISDMFQEQTVNIFREMLKEKTFDHIRTIDDFYFSFCFPFENFLDLFLKEYISKNEEVIYIHKNYWFLKNHFEFWIDKVEGPACSYDKLKSIINGLLNFYSTGEEINFDYSQEYIYHLPKVVFKEHNQIVDFYECLKYLHIGDPLKYLQEVKKIKSRIDKFIKDEQENHKSGNIKK